MSKEKKQSKMPKNYNPSENQLTFMKEPQDTKVMIWGYELCTGAEWKDFLDVVKKLGKEKTDLEAKLAESEKALNQRKEMFIALQEQCAKDIKEKEIEIHCWKCSTKDWKQHHEKLLDDLVRITNKVEQDKISFAVEKLEEVKEIISQRYSFDVEECDFAVAYEDDIEEIFNQQIKAIKEERKNG